ncbi:RHS repeat-associated core domain-containing protein [Clostridia bacterium]|nr:RHS repeat-associated core domain-containing protein [Clostridia bacterium]
MNMIGLVTELRRLKGLTSLSTAMTAFPDWKWKMPDGTIQHYSFDDLGNIKSLTEMIETPSGSHMIFENRYTYDVYNRLQLKKTTRGEETSFLRFSYDQEGNQLQKDEVFQGIYGSIVILTDEFRYNGYNQLVGVEDTAGFNTYYKYNGQNLRTSKENCGETTYFIYDGNANIIVELDGRSAVTALNVRGLRLLSREANGNDYYYLHNAHGDVTKLTDGLGKIVEEYTYDPYGNAVDSPDYQMQGVMPELMSSQMVNPIDNPYRYAGEYLDAETGNYYLRARYYDPSTQRFTSEDSYRGELCAPLSLNRYSYCMGNPIIYVDPSGNESTEELIMMNIMNETEEGKKILDELFEESGYVLPLEDGKTAIIVTADATASAGGAAQYSAGYVVVVDSIGRVVSVGRITSAGAGGGYLDADLSATFAKIDGINSIEDLEGLGTEFGASSAIGTLTFGAGVTCSNDDNRYRGNYFSVGYGLKSPAEAHVLETYTNIYTSPDAMFMSWALGPLGDLLINQLGLD